MNNPDYMGMIQGIANRAYCSESLSEELIREWTRLEKILAPWNYDILRNDSDVRQLLDKMVRMLYKLQPSAGPQLDVEQLVEKNAKYGGSWCARGGAGAFFTVIRKVDRYLEMKKLGKPDDEDTLGDWRRYLILFLAWHRAAYEVPLESERKVPRVDPSVHALDASMDHCVKCGATPAECMSRPCIQVAAKP